MGGRREKHKVRPYSEWNELKNALRSIQYSFPYLLSHHPHCSWYSRDVLRLGRWRFCWGCIVTYPTMIVTLTAIIFLGIHHRFDWWQFVAAGVILGSFEFISLWRKGRGLRHRTIKFFLGLGLAFVTVGVFTIPISLFLRILIYFHLYLLAGLFGSLRVVAMEKKCKRCSWSALPGTDFFSGAGGFFRLNIF
ncbi:MAG: hypothetical protein ACMUHY_08060 [Thermoplasmatota archaeon]